jgi:hypothetical protein
MSNPDYSALVARQRCYDSCLILPRSGALRRRGLFGAVGNLLHSRNLVELSYGQESQTH